MISQELLDILVCPDNRTPVHTADDALLARLNAAIDAGAVKNRAGEAVTDRADSGLVREDGAYVYIVRDDIPIMLKDEAVPLDQLK
jgi:uncharacterized protein YbaR (Trm112 family)